MKTPKNSLLLFQSIRQSKCKFASLCTLYSKSSFTCMNMGGEYCGKYRILNSKLEVKTELLGGDLTENPVLV